jgi:hypothetical protein
MSSGKSLSELDSIYLTGVDIYSTLYLVEDGVESGGMAEGAKKRGGRV